MSATMLIYVVILPGLQLNDLLLQRFQLLCQLSYYCMVDYLVVLNHHGTALTRSKTFTATSRNHSLNKKQDRK